MNRQTELIAMTQREDFRPVSCLADERIVRRHSSVLTQAQHLAIHGICVLRLFTKRRTGRDVKEPVGAKREPRTARAVVPIADEEILNVRQSLTVELATRQNDRAL